jgi:hypothetical protein
VNLPATGFGELIGGPFGRLVAVLGLQIGMLAEKVRDLGLDRLRDQAVCFSHDTQALRDSASRTSRLRFPTGTAVAHLTISTNYDDELNAL